jgi:hypothetical protein
MRTPSPAALAWVASKDAEVLHTPLRSPSSMSYRLAAAYDAGRRNERNRLVKSSLENFGHAVFPPWTILKSGHHEWEYFHDGYPDSTDARAGRGGSVDECLEAIRELEGE